MLQVFRIEHRDTRVGPFQTYSSYTQKLVRWASERRDLLSPWQDGLGDLPWSYVFGCPDMDCLRQWFLLGNSPRENGHIVRKLKDAGFVLAEYLVAADECRVSTSGIQLAFYPEQSREEGLVAYRGLDELLH